MKNWSSSSIVRTVKDECGEEGCERLISAFGGMRISIPKKVAGKFLQPLGEDVLALLVREYGGLDIDVPSRGHIERIWKSLRLKYDAVHSDLSANELAAKHGVTSAWVHKLRSQLREPATNNSSTRKD